MSVYSFDGADGNLSALANYTPMVEPPPNDLAHSEIDFATGAGPGSPFALSGTGSFGTADFQAGFWLLDGSIVTGAYINVEAAAGLSLSADGSLDAGNTETIYGTLDQTGGTNTISSGAITVFGIYTQTGGTLADTGSYLFVDDGAAFFEDDQSATVSVSGLETGASAYNLEAGQLSVANYAFIAKGGSNGFKQTGGTAAIGSTLVLGFGDSIVYGNVPDEQATYYQTGGNLSAGSMILADGGTGLFVYATTGNDTISGTMYIGYDNNLHGGNGEIDSSVGIFDVASTAAGTLTVGTLYLASNDMTVAGADTAHGAYFCRSNDFDLNITGTDNNGNSLVIGDAGSSTFEQYAGTTSVTGNLVIGNNGPFSSLSLDNTAKFDFNGSVMKLGVGTGTVGVFYLNASYAGTATFNAMSNALTVQVGIAGTGRIKVGSGVFQAGDIQIATADGNSGSNLTVGVAAITAVPDVVAQTMEIGSFNGSTGTDGDLFVNNGYVTVSNSVALADSLSSGIIFSNAGSVEIGGDHGPLKGILTVDAGASLTGRGLIGQGDSSDQSQGQGQQALAQAYTQTIIVANGGQIGADGGVLKINANVSATTGNVPAASFGIEAGAVLDLNGTVDPSVSVVFNGAGVLQLAQSTPGPTISGFAAGDIIDLLAVPFPGPASTQLTAGNVLQIGQGSAKYALHLDPTQNFSGVLFQLSPDGYGGTWVMVGQPTTVASGQTATNPTITTGSMYTVNGTLTGGTLQTGATLLIATTGIATGTTLNGGSQTFSWGMIEDTTVNDQAILNLMAGQGTGIKEKDPGTENIYGGAVDSNSLVSGGVQNVLSGGLAVGATVESGSATDGIQDVETGGAASSTVVSGGGAEMIQAGATAVATSVGSGGQITVESGGTASGILFAAGASATIDGGTLVLDAADTAGQVNFSAGTLTIGGTAMPASLVISGFAAGDTIDLAAVAFDSAGTASATGSSLDVFESGQHYELQFAAALSGTFELGADAGSGTDITSAVIVGSGGTTAVSDTETSAGLDIQSGGTAVVSSGGTADATTVRSGGLFILQSGGTADPTIVLSGGSEVVSAGAEDDGAELSGGIQIVHGVVSGVTVGSGAEGYIGADGIAAAELVLGGGAEVVFGSDTDATLIGTSAATATQYDFGIALGGVTYANGFQEVALAGAVASGMTIEFGGEQYVGSGGTTLAALVGSGGAEVVFGIDSGASVSGTQYLYSVASGGTTQSGGFQLVAPGATAIGMTVAYGGEQYVGSGGTTLGAIIASGGAEEVHGFDSGANLSGTQYLYGTAFGGTTYGNGEQLVASGATASGMTVESGGQQYIGSGGTALATTIVAQGVEQVFGSDSGALVSGTQYVFGIASGGTTFNGGSQQVEFGATAIGMTLSAGGQQNVGGGGTAIGTDIMSQGAEIVHGTDLGATISGTQYVDGLASGTVVDTGGYQLVSAGGTISAAGISGGTIELMAGASNGTAPISFAGAGELILDASTAFSGTVAGFDSAGLNDSIDFADIPYVSAGSAGATTVTWTPAGNSSGTLTVAEGNHTANITLLGQYTGTFSGTAADGGTLVTYSPGEAVTDANPPPLTTPHPA